MGLFSRKKHDKKVSEYFVTDNEVSEKIREEEIKRRLENKILYDKVVKQELAGQKEASQPLLVFVSSRGARVLGFPVSYGEEGDRVLIYYQKKPPGFLDDLWWTIKSFFGAEWPGGILIAQRELVKFTEDAITVFGDKIRSTLDTNVYEVVPAVEDPVTRASLAAYEAVKTERDLLYEALKKQYLLFDRLISEAALMNVSYKQYRQMKEVDRKTKKEKSELSGNEFTALPVLRLIDEGGDEE